MQSALFSFRREKNKHIMDIDYGINENYKFAHFYCTKSSNEEMYIFHLSASALVRTQLKILNRCTLC